MSGSQPNLAIKKDTGRGSPRVEIGHGMSFATYLLAWAPLSWLGSDTSFAHPAVVRRGPVGPEAAALSFIFPATGLHSQVFSFHSTAKGYDKTLPGQWHHSSGLSPALGMCPDQRQDLKSLCQPTAALLGLSWANSVASSTLCPSSMCAHCREGNWDQRDGNNGEPHLWPCI